MTSLNPYSRSAKRQAHERGVTLSTLLEDALRFHLARKQPANAAPFQLDTVAGKLVQPNLDLDRTSNLEGLDDELKFSALDPAESTHAQIACDFRLR